jgi:hypothetical protein
MIVCNSLVRARRFASYICAFTVVVTALGGCMAGVETEEPGSVQENPTSMTAAMQQADACTASCGGNSCTGSVACTCDGDSPVCT